MKKTISIMFLLILLTNSFAKIKVKHFIDLQINNPYSKISQEHALAFENTATGIKYHSQEIVNSIIHQNEQEKSLFFEKVNQASCCKGDDPYMLLHRIEMDYFGEENFDELESSFDTFLNAPCSLLHFHIHENNAPSKTKHPYSSKQICFNTKTISERYPISVVIDFVNDCIQKASYNNDLVRYCHYLDKKAFYRLAFTLEYAIYGLNKVNEQKSKNYYINLLLHNYNFPWINSYK